MSSYSPSGAAVRALASAFNAAIGSARFSSALTVTAIGTALCAFALRQLMGWAGLLAIIVTLAVLAIASLVAQWENVGWRALMPLSLLTFTGWAVASVFWSQYQWVTLGGLGYLAAFTILAVYIALVRDAIQIVRAFGDVLRVVLLVSIVLEVFSGLLIDTPIPFLGVSGSLDAGGPISGIVGSQNQLGIVAVIALITFGTEARTRSISREISVSSIVLAFLLLLFSQSSVAIGVFVLVGVATVALLVLRRVPSGRRRYWQVVTFSLMAVAAAVVWSFRSPIISALNVQGELNFRLNAWQKVWELIPIHNVEGWGWIGIWRQEVPPFTLFEDVSSRVPASAYNGYLDVWLQLGVVGLAIFIGFLGLAFVRSWLLASRRRSIVFAWAPLVLAALMLNSLAESTILIEFGWLTVVVCSVKAARELSWRTAFDAAKRE
jgi:O-antigen ligase